jgi:methionyl-tRNA synthetase
LLDPKQLIKPRCKICNKSPIWKETEHFFLKLSAFEEILKSWVRKSSGWRINAKNFTTQLLKQGLRDRAITRDIDWGVPIPLPGYKDKRIYVWFEAVCGYLSASIEWSKQQKDKNLWKGFWQEKKTESVISYYVHGKDNIPFHTIIWPSILLGAGGLHLPNRIISSEHLTLEKQQFSTSRNWAVWLPDFLAVFDPETLRYYLSVSGPESRDADFSWLEFQAKINKELIGNFGNFIHRTFSFIEKNFPNGITLDGRLNNKQRSFLKQAQETFSLVGTAIEAGEFSAGLRTAFNLVVKGNRFFNDAKPWAKIKTDAKQVEQDLGVVIQVIRCLAILVSPYLPQTTERLSTALNEQMADLAWKYPREHWPIKISQVRPLYKRIEDSEIEQQLSRLENLKLNEQE